MVAMLCPPATDLERLFLGGLPNREADDLEQHVLECGDCLKKLKDLLAAKDLLSEVLAGQKSAPTATLPPMVDDLIARLSSFRFRSANLPYQESPMISISCSACQKKLSVKESLAGKKVKCPGCGQVLAVPAPAAVPAGGEDMRTLPPTPAREPAGPERTVPPADAGNAHTESLASKSEVTRGAGQPADDHDSSLTDFLAPAQAADELGRLGKYRILKVLGHGGMGVVYKAEDMRLERQVAIKAMLPALAASASAGKRFLREAKTMAAVEHDHIVRIYQVDEERGVPFLAMEFLKGEPLDVRLQREEKLPLAEVLRIGREIAEGLSAAHATGLIHRDIKPGNIWLEAPRNRVKILDFGLARATSEDSGLTQQGAIIGTPAYMAPEQGRGDPVDARSDLFSLGVVLYRLCSGQQPFQGKDTVSTLMAVAMHQPPTPLQLNAELPPELSDLVMRLLAKDPAQRPASAGEVVQTLQALENKLARERDPEDKTIGLWPPQPKPATDSGKPGRAGPLRRWPVLITALVLLAGLAGLGLWASGLIRFQAEQGDLVLDTDDPEFAFSVVKGGGITLEDRKTKRTYHVKAVVQGKDEHELEITDPDANLAFKTKTFTIKRGDKVALKTWFERKEAAADKSLPDDPWLKQVAAMPPEKQVEAVAARLQKHNPRFDGKVTHKIEDGVVTGLTFWTDNVTDISPVRALQGLRHFTCGGHGSSRTLTDLSPLKGMKLTNLYCSGTGVADLSPLKDMQLTVLECSNTRVTDLSLLKDMKLTNLACSNTRVSDLLPLRDMMLKELNCNNTRVTDLSPLRQMKLTDLDCHGTSMSDLSPLRDMMLTRLNCRSTAVADLSPLKDMKLTMLECIDTPVADLSPLKGMPLTLLSCDGTKVADLSPLKGMKLTMLQCSGTAVADLSPLKDMKLVHLKCAGTKVADLSPLKDMKLARLDCSETKVTDLSPLKGMPLKELKYDFKPERDADILRSIKTLEKINDKPAKEILK